MFELSVARKYLIPRWRQLSVSIISMISILVIALVVWLIVVFFSVTNGLEKAWTQKLIALTAPVRISPTDAYYNSYYYQIDSISASSDYTYKSLAEKLKASSSDPYVSDQDEEIPSQWQAAERNPDGSLKDIVKETFSAIRDLKDFPGLKARDYEITFANLRLRLVRDHSSSPFSQEIDTNQASLSHAIWLASFDEGNSGIAQAMYPVRMEDLQNVLHLLAISNENIREDSPETNLRLEKKDFQAQTKAFFENATIRGLKTADSGWVLPKNLYPELATFQVCLILKGNVITRLVIPQETKTLRKLKEQLDAAGFQTRLATMQIKNGMISVETPEEGVRILPKHIPLVLEGGVDLQAEFLPQSLETARQANQLKFAVLVAIQGQKLSGESSLGNLEIAKADVKTHFAEKPAATPFWIHYVDHAGSQEEKTALMAYDSLAGESVLLPKTFKEAGVLIGDRGYLSYYTPTASSFQEQRIPVFVAGFYDQGIIPIGGKLVLANQELTSLIRSSYQQDDKTMGTGINVNFDNLNQAEQVKAALQKAFREKGLDRYWTVETYREYDFTKDIIQQLSSEKNLFSVIAMVIIIVACSNIISMLIILVNDKKLEIGILRSMGASSTSIATIFGLCGIFMGLLGSLIGTLAAMITLKNLPALIAWVGKLQGYEMFNANFYGQTIPHELSYEALAFVLAATVLISLLAGIVPAVKASLLKPSAILRSE